MKFLLAAFTCTSSLLCTAALPTHSSHTSVRYRLLAPSQKASAITEFALTYEGEWVRMHLRKRDSSAFDVWLLRPAAPRRYILREGSGPAVEYLNPVTREPVLPSVVSFQTLLPATLEGTRDVQFLGHRYRPDGETPSSLQLPPDIGTVFLRPDLLIGPASNSRPTDDTRRWDGSDYATRRLTAEDYRELAAAGATCVRVDDGQAEWAHALGLFYWGAGEKLPFPEMLFRPQYLGPVLYLDEPAVSTRDHVLRPRLAADAAFRKSIRPRDAVEAFTRYYDEALQRTAGRLGALLQARSDVEAGNFRPVQANLYSWDTMISTAAFELTRSPLAPEAFVFEPPGRIGAKRTLPELNMTAGTQYAATDTTALTDLIFSFLRGGARMAGKNWGVSIYGAVDRADAPVWLTRAYDLGATRFHFWDNYQLACVPFNEILSLATHLRKHADSNPERDMERLRRAAEVAITLPPGYDLGHTQMGRGNLWGLPELNLERRNEAGVTYRTVMSNYHLEAERCLRLGVSFDTFPALGDPLLQGYREVIHIRENGKVEVESEGRRKVMRDVRRAEPKAGGGPELSISADTRGGDTVAVARIREGSAPVFYTHGTDDAGVYRNAAVLWELFGPGEEDYRFLTPERLRPDVRRNGSAIEARITFRTGRAGVYRLRAATVDTAGRSRVVWTTISQTEPRDALAPNGTHAGTSAPR